MATIKRWNGSAWEYIGTPTTVETTDTAQTITGLKTFATAPVFPDSSIPLVKLSATGTRDATTFLRGDGTWQVVAAGAPSNMVTTDTNQTIAGKTVRSATIPTFAFEGAPGATGLISLSLSRASGTVDLWQGVTGTVKFLADDAPGDAAFRVNTGTNAFRIGFGTSSSAVSNFNLNINGLILTGAGTPVFVTQGPAANALSILHGFGRVPGTIEAYVGIVGSNKLFANDTAGDYAIRANTAAGAINLGYGTVSTGNAALKISSAGVVAGVNLYEGVNRVYSAGFAPPYPVTSVATRTGAVTLTAADISPGTFPSGTYNIAGTNIQLLGGTGAISLAGGLTTVGTINSISNHNANVASSATAGTVTVTSPSFVMQGAYWTGTASAVANASLSATPASPSGAVTLNITAAVTNTSGTLMENGNRVYSAANPAPISGVAGGVLTGTYPNPAFAAGSITDAAVATTAAIAETKLALASDGPAATPTRRTLGTGATQAMPGNAAALNQFLGAAKIANNDISGTSGTWSAVTGSTVTFVAPTSGKVICQLSGNLYAATANGANKSGSFALSSSSTTYTGVTDLSGLSAFFTWPTGATSSINHFNSFVIVDGLTAGTTYTWTWWFNPGTITTAGDIHYTSSSSVGGSGFVTVQAIN
jgi:hypothetical protein